MRRLLGLLMLIVGLAVLVGSSANLREYYGDRNFVVYIADNNSSYVSFDCPKSVNVQSGGKAGVITLTNSIGYDADFYVYSYNGLLTFPNPIHLANRESRLVEATYNGGYGEYDIPLKIYAYWSNGSATVDACNVHVTCYPVELKKTLISGNRTVRTHTLEYWTFRVELKNHGNKGYFTVRDTIPAELNVSKVEATNGTYLIEERGGKMGSTEIEWNVYVNGGGVEYIDITVYTRLNPAGKRGFTSPGYYYLNEGAELVGWNVRSNGIVVHAVD